MSKTGWICSRCGVRGAQPLASRPSLDDRHAVGYCTACSPIAPAGGRFKQDQQGRWYEERTGKPWERPTMHLVRADIWDPDAFAERLRREADAKLVKKYAKGELSAADMERAPEILKRYDEQAARAS